LIVLLTGSLNLTVNIEAQKTVLFVLPLFPIFMIFFIGCIAETNRAPFDLAEAESELVSGFMTEHSAAIFVFFFLAEYASIVLICIFTSILFLGGYLTFFTLHSLLNILYYINIELNFIDINLNIFLVMLQGLVYSLSLGLKSCILIFVFI
jgi:NADH-ubiquinone oxidoreductase chain 1